MLDCEYDYVTGKIGPDEYWAHVSGEFDFAEIGENCLDFADFAKGVLDKGFNDLDCLDRGHEIWNNTNRLATVHRMYSYADYLIDSGDNPVFGAWLHICLALVRGQRHLALKHWKIVKDSNQLNPKWLVLSAWNTSPYWFDLNVEPLADIIVALNLFEEVKGPLDFLATAVDSGGMTPSPHDWVEKVKEIIKPEVI